MDKIKNEMMDDIKANKPTSSAVKRASLELERALLKEREADNKAKFLLQDKAKQDQLLLQYKADIQRLSKL